MINITIDPQANYKGIAQLCFIPNKKKYGGSMIRGHLITLPQKKTYGISGTQKITSCSCLGDQRLFDIKIIEYDSNKEVQEEIELTGGDFLHIESPHMKFATSTVKCDQQAEEHIQKFFKGQYCNMNAIVCIGDMSIFGVDFEQVDPDTTLELRNDALESLHNCVVDQIPGLVPHDTAHVEVQETEDEDKQQDEDFQEFYGSKAANKADFTSPNTKNATSIRVVTSPHLKQFKKQASDEPKDKMTEESTANSNNSNNNDETVIGFESTNQGWLSKRSKSNLNEMQM